MKLIQSTKINYLFVISITIFLSWAYFSNNNDNRFVSATSNAIESVVSVYSFSGSRAFSESNIGSGVIFSEDGYIVTNTHIINRNKIIRVKLHSGEEFDANLIGSDANADIAILKINTNKMLKPIIISNSDDIKVGDKVLAIGNPYGIGISVSGGIISATGRDYGNPYLELIQTDAAINPGNSGGALINHKGNLIGMNTKIFSKTGSYAGIGFALPANKMIEVASEIIQYGSVKKSWVGDFRVKVKRFLLNNKPTYGLEILELNNYGPLFNDGNIKPGAIILSVNDKPPSWENLTYALNNSFPGDEISFQILQDSKMQNFTVVTEGIPDQ